MPLQILVISDDRLLAADLCRRLAAAGHETSLVPAGEDPFAAVRRVKPGLLIVAVAASRAEELAVEQRLHTPEGTRSVPVIVISDSPELEAELLQPFDYLVHPFDPQRLLDDVAAIAGRPRGGRRLPELGGMQREFADHIRSRTGLDFSAHNRGSLERAVGRRMSTLRLDSPAGYLAYLVRHGEDRYELQKLLQYLTVGETCFFRYPSHFDALRERLSTGVPPTEPIRIWSAGCSTGEEPYSIAIAVMEALPDWRERDIRIIATDIDARALKRAKGGVYTPWSLRMTDAPRRLRYFRQQGRNFLVRDEVKGLVEFRRSNLAPPGGAGMAPLPRLDAVFCRNVLIYFSAETADRLVRRFAATLKESGQLFLGHAEALSDRYPDLEIRRRGKSFFYLKSSPQPAGTDTVPAIPAVPTVPIVAAIPEVAPPRSEPGGESAAARLETAWRMFHARQPAAAALLVEGVLRESPDETGARVLEGFLLAGEGRLGEALVACDRALARDDLRADAYFLSGVVLEALGLTAVAADEYRKALLLEHDFIMPRFRLGLVHQRLGRFRDAARELGNSIRMLSATPGTGAVPYSGGLSRADCLQELHAALERLPRTEDPAG